jgi:hypothetical protein
MGDNMRKAQLCLDGVEPLAVLGGKKVLAFYASILNPQGDSVCVDRHAYDVAVGRVTNDDARTVLALVGAYEQVAEAYVRAAQIAGIGACALQAITWVAWRAQKGIAD